MGRILLVGAQVASYGRTEVSAAPVLVVGAGPVGLVLACDLAWRGVPVRIIDASREPSKQSKAIGIFARTLELLENIRVAEEIVQRAVGVESIDMYAGRHRIASLNTQRIESRYNRVYTLEQSETESILIARLAALGIRVERPVRLESLHSGSQNSGAVVRHPDGQVEEINAAWLVGCDGAHSTVRKTLGIPFEGERYLEAFDLADVHLEGAFQPARSISLFLSQKGVVFLAPLPGEQRFRAIVDEPPGSAAERREAPDLEDVRSWWNERVEYPPARDAVFTDAEWLSRFTIHRRMTPIVRQGRIFLAGDAAHVHSPAGGQGMNGGIQDAINLSWKLALVVQGGARESLLDTYAEERLPITRTVLRATHLITKMATLDNPFLQTMRARAMSMMLSSPAIQRHVVNLASGLYTNYRKSLAVEHTERGWLERIRQRGRLSAGDRAPDPHLGGPYGSTLYEYLRHPGHTLLAFTGSRPDATTLTHLGEAIASISAMPGEVRCLVVTQTNMQIPGAAADMVQDPRGAVHAAYGLPEGGLCLIRPDRYVALRTTARNSQFVRDVLDRA